MKVKTIVAGIALALFTFETQAVEVEVPDNNKIIVKEVCVNSLAYVLAVSGEGQYRLRGIAITQVFVRTNSSFTPHPKEC